MVQLYKRLVPRSVDTSPVGHSPGASAERWTGAASEGTGRRMIAVPCFSGAGAGVSLGDPRDSGLVHGLLQATADLGGARDEGNGARRNSCLGGRFGDRLRLWRLARRDGERWPGWQRRGWRLRREPGQRRRERGRGRRLRREPGQRRRERGRGRRHGGDGGSGGVPCAGSSTPCTAGQVCVHQTCGGPAAVCTPLPDGGQCASGWTRVDQCASGIGPGCEPPPCEPPPPHCADVPVACAGTPSCGCLTIGVCQGNGACLIVSGSQVTCGTE